MATIKLEVVAGAQTTTTLKTIANADLARFIAAYRAARTVDASLTDAQIVSAWHEDVLRQARGMVLAYEKQMAASNAANAVAEIGMT